MDGCGVWFGSSSVTTILAQLGPGASVVAAILALVAGPGGALLAFASVICLLLPKPRPALGLGLGIGACLLCSFALVALFPYQADVPPLLRLGIPGAGLLTASWPVLKGFKDFR